ncbi:hypothetical protein AVEN_78172-1 [Araneus ventricosus]|uniref:Uncharacterized protein n=1 Tax=Araneus ventricosus TaxID=182803 RepID=A0A4Y2KPA7_ARAVE|nr:hypothetical protein AVEN_78172-1 [Araneus ventricosus]
MISVPFPGYQHFFSVPEAAKSLLDNYPLLLGNFQPHEQPLILAQQLVEDVDELTKEGPELNKLSILKSQISDKFARLETCQADISNLILKVEDAEQVYEEDFLSAEKYRDNYIALCSQIEQTCLKDSSTKDLFEKRKFKHPKIELKKFDGNAKDYLTFWSQFQKILKDSSIPNEEKFQYLRQAVVPK